MPTPIFHITHIDNLPSIIQQGCLWSDSKKIAQGLSCVNIAHASLKERRAQTIVPLPPGGTLDEYVPFYFAPRSPMLYAIKNNRVDGYGNGQNPIIYLVSTAEAIAQAQLPFVFYDGHPVMHFSQAYQSLNDLNAIDLEVMKSKYWFDSDQNPDRKRKRMAEFLVHNHFPISLILGIGVYDSIREGQVKTLVAGLSHVPVVQVKKNWYY